MKMAFLKCGFLIGAFAFCVSCGTRGQTTPAPPMWGKAKVEYDAAQAKKAEEEKAKQEETKQ